MICFQEIFGLHGLIHEKVEILSHLKDSVTQFFSDLKVNAFSISLSVISLTFINIKQ